MRLRFAPSPTGVLHIGSARTALYNWLLARGSQGTLVLRIEDTDRERSNPETVKQIIEALEWLELDWDEGPIFQSERYDRHREVVEQLLAEGKAYRSTAGPMQVQEYKKLHDNRGFRGEEESEGAVRLRMPDEGATVVNDIIRGESTFENVLLDDLVIARADGSPVYQLAVVVDDLDSEITHVVRGADHYSNTPKQMQIMAALGVEPPKYAHLPLLHGTDGKKLSKRHGAASVQELRDAGYLPAAVRNYTALLGWGYDNETTFFPTEDLIEKFSLERVSKSPAIFDEKKLRWMNGRYVRELPVAELKSRLEALTEHEIPDELVAISQEKISTLDEFAPLTKFFFDGVVDDPKAREKFLSAPETPAVLTDIKTALVELSGDWTPESVEVALAPIPDRHEVKPKAVYQPLRVALTGTTISPGIFETVVVLGKAEVLARLDAAISRTA